MDICYQSIGTIYTPYLAINTPDQPIADAPGDFWITLKPNFCSALKTLNTFNYIYVIYHLDQVSSPIEPLTRSPWAPETEIGLFASRSSRRPNPIGLSIVQVKEIKGNEITISGIDTYNGTPLLDIKPYLHFLDSKEDANNGWFDTLPAKEHIMAHVLGLSHKHDQEDTHTHQDSRRHVHKPIHDQVRARYSPEHND